MRVIMAGADIGAAILGVQSYLFQGVAAIMTDLCPLSTNKPEPWAKTSMEHFDVADPGSGTHGERSAVRL
jgi:hypothetical protein